MAYPPILWSCAAINFPCKPIAVAPYNQSAQSHDDEIRTHSEFLERGEGRSIVCLMLGPSADKLWPAWRATCIVFNPGLAPSFLIIVFHRPPSSKLSRDIICHPRQSSSQLIVVSKDCRCEDESSRAQEEVHARPPTTVCDSQQENLNAQWKAVQNNSLTSWMVSQTFVKTRWCGLTPKRHAMIWPKFAHRCSSSQVAIPLLRDHNNISAGVILRIVQWGIQS